MIGRAPEGLPPGPAGAEALRQNAVATIRAHSTFFLIEGVVLLVLGTLAVMLPNVATLEIELLLGWLFLIGGFARGITLVRRRHMPARWWRVASSVFAILIGAMLIARPIQGVLSLTLLVTVLFVAEGVAAVFIALEFRRYLRSWSVILFSGIVNLLLAVLIFQGWPNSAAWVLGLLVGINLVFGGVSLIMTALAARRLAGPSASAGTLRS